jgi:hypothetical protein
MKSFLLACVLVVCSFMVGCGGSSSGGGGGGGSQNASINSGNWYVEATSLVSAGQKSYILGGLVQTGTTISGTMHIDNSNCYDLFNDNVPFSGSVSGSTVTLTSASVTSQVIKVTGTITSASALTGTYTITGGCANGDHGSITAMHVPPISGTWKATEVSGSTTITTTVNITQQSTANPDGSFNLTGTVTFTNSPCATTGTINTVSFTAGDVVAVAVDTNEVGGGHGQLVFFGYLGIPASQTAISGAYQYASGVCNGSTGNLNFTKQ